MIKNFEEQNEDDLLFFTGNVILDFDSHSNCTTRSGTYCFATIVQVPNTYSEKYFF